MVHTEKLISLSLAAALLLAATAAWPEQPGNAAVSAQCRSDAEEYGIPAEQRDAYIADCIASLGGYYDAEPDSMMQEDTGITEDTGAGPEFEDAPAPPELDEYGLPR